MRKHTLAELCINIGDGQAVVSKEDLIEFHDCLPLSIPELEYVLWEAKYYILYRNHRIADKLFDEFPEIPDVPHTHAAQMQFDQLIYGFPEKDEPKPFDQLVSEFPEQDDPHISRLADLISDVEASKRDVVLVSTWGIQCGIATYTKYLYGAIKKIDNQFPLSVHPISEGVDGVVGRVVHFQHEFGIIPKIPRTRSKVIVTFHSVPENMRSILAAYEKNLNIVAYVAHFQEAKDIISAGTEKDVWLIPHGSKIITGASDPAVKEYFRKLIEIPIDEPCAYMFGFQSDNKNYAMVTKACEKAGIRLIISGAVNEHANYRGNIGCGRDNVVLGRFLSEIEVDLYALASDILLFQTNPLEHYSCSGALHRVVGAGRPVICNRVNHYSDLVENEDCLKYDGQGQSPPVKTGGMSCEGYGQQVDKEAKNMQQLEERNTYTPTDIPHVRSNCDPILNREETLGVSDSKTSSNNSDAALTANRVCRTELASTCQCYSGATESGIRQPIRYSATNYHVRRGTLPPRTISPGYPLPLQPTEDDGQDELEQKIAEALEKKEEFGRKALEYAERTSWEIVAKKHMEMYEKYSPK